MKKYSDKTSKGYRLRRATHSLIKSLQEMTGSDSDEVITNSCRLYLKNIVDTEPEYNIKQDSNNAE